MQSFIHSNFALLHFGTLTITALKEELSIIFDRMCTENQY